MPGTIIFKPLEVNLLSDKSLFGKSDPYCIVSLGNQKIQTKVIEKNEKHTPCPTFQVIDEPTCMVEIKDQENLDSSNHIGACQVSLDEIESKGSLKRWYSIYNTEDKPTGKILLEATFTQESLTPTDFPASLEDIMITPEDKLMTPEDSDEDMRWTNILNGEDEVSSYAYKYSEQPDILLDDQLSPMELEFPLHKKDTTKKGRNSLNQKGALDRDLDDPLEEYKTDLAINLQQYKPRRSVAYRSHPLEIEGESPTFIEPTKKSKSQELKKSNSLKKSETPMTNEENSLDLYRQVMGSRWDL